MKLMTSLTLAGMKFEIHKTGEWYIVKCRKVTLAECQTYNECFYWICRRAAKGFKDIEKKVKKSIDRHI